ncbi:hypothetical protein DV702_09680 [Sporosarcina sp. PTS2304]|uniref:GDYXXLXY domain-containing protein n=1 Tax=Sporosarcina sp. PTS2304 TaxID=2283194 RepID=UPI000E0D6FE9|nr:GDYXXLXY domain-containing protein [Sporosarcina sp. PTS2304]AXH99970.1 hypothetical protein DV702_09680 [Sporosarcina sp. PTS2304]
MKNKRNLFLIALIVPILLLVSMTWKPLWTVNKGETVLLETIPVDPRDILYGDYVQLQFAIEEFGPDSIEPALLDKLTSKYSGNLKVYAVLERQNSEELYGLKMITDKKPSDDLYLEGTMYYYGEPYDGSHTVYYADFLPDRFYVSENTGTELEKLSQRGKLLAEMKVKDGFAVLQDIYPK